MPFAGHDHLLRLFFDWQRADQGSDFFGSLPLGELAQTLLTGPNARVNDLQKFEHLFAEWACIQTFRNSCPERGLKMKIAPSAKWRQI
jgi:hypothetical protein